MTDTTLYIKILDYLKNLIDENRDVPNFMLPSERFISLKFCTSRHPVRLAYDKLIAKNEVVKIHGKGYYIKQSQDDDNTDLNNTPKQITFITPSINSIFSRALVSGVEKFCLENHLNLSIETSNNNILQEKRLLQKSLYTRDNGVILFPCDNEDDNEILLQFALKKIPITILDRYIPGFNFSYVGTDNYLAMVESVEFLYNLNYKNIVYISLPRDYATSIAERINGFNYGLIKYYGSSNSHNLLKISNNKNEQLTEIENYLKSFPETQVVIATGNLANAIIDVAAKLNIAIPDKLKLMVFDDELSSLEKKVWQPFVIKQDSENIGYHAARLAYNQLYGDKRKVITRFQTIIDNYNSK